MRIKSMKKKILERLTGKVANFQGPVGIFSTNLNITYKYNTQYNKF